MEVRERGRAIAAVAGLLVLVLVSVIFLTSRPRDSVSWFESALRDGMTPLLLVVSRVTQTVTGAWESAVSVKDAHQENIRLRAELETLRREIARLEESERQNQAFRMALNLPANTPRPVLYAEVIARPLNNWWGVLTINKGRRHGVTPQSGVVASAGVVGHVRTAGNFSSEVVLLVDPRSAVGGIVQRTGAPVLVEGVGFPGTELRLRPLSTGVDIREGDVIVTSGLSLLFPKGIPIGVVEQVDVGPFGLSVDVIVRPFVDFGALEVVTVLLDETSGAVGDGERNESETGPTDADESHVAEEPPRP